MGCLSAAFHLYFEYCEMEEDLLKRFHSTQNIMGCLSAAFHLYSFAFFRDVPNDYFLDPILNNIEKMLVGLWDIHYWSSPQNSIAMVVQSPLSRTYLCCMHDTSNSQSIICTTRFCDG